MSKSYGWDARKPTRAVPQPRSRGDECELLDLRGQVLHLSASLPEDIDAFEYKCHRPLPGEVSEEEARLLEQNRPGPEIAATLVGLCGSNVVAGEAPMVPACAVLAKAKQFDDGLLAAVKLLVHKGRLSKAPVLAAVADALAGTAPRPAAAAALALELGGGPSVPPGLRKHADELRDAWRCCDDLGGKALGFYIWSEELRQVYAQDRFLQQQLHDLGSMLLSQSDVDQLRGLVSSDDALHSATAKHEELRRRLCNGFRYSGILAPEPECWYPPCVSPESLLIERIKKDLGFLPEGFDLASEVARRVREGSLSLAPEGDLSGWYSHCLWALEPLLKPDQTPEASKLRMKSRYCEGLETLFASAMALTRETHVMDLALPPGICPAPRRGRVLPKLEVYAHLSVEPLAECYLRRARSYEFVRSVLEDCFQPEELAGVRRLRADGGSAKKPLMDELREMERLLRGLHGVVMHELGFVRPEQPEATKEDEEAARDWLRRFKDDSDVAEDARMMVPVFYDDDKGMWKTPNNEMASAAQWRPLQVMRAHKGAVLTVRFNRPGSYCLSGGSDRTIVLWNPHNGKFVKSYSGHSGDVLGIDVSSDSSRMVSCGFDRQPFLWDVTSGTILRRFRGHDSRVNAVQMNEEGTMMVTGSFDHSAKVWDLKSRSIDAVQVLTGSRDSVSSVVVAPPLIVTGSVDGGVRVYDVRKGTLFTDQIGVPVTSISMTHDNNCILASTLDSTLRLIDVASGSMLNEYRGHTNVKYRVDCCLPCSDAMFFERLDQNPVVHWTSSRTGNLYHGIKRRHSWFRFGANCAESVCGAAVKAVSYVPGVGLLDSVATSAVNGVSNAAEFANTRAGHVLDSAMVAVNSRLGETTPGQVTRSFLRTGEAAIDKLLPGEVPVPRPVGPRLGVIEALEKNADVAYVLHRHVADKSPEAVATQAVTNLAAEVVSVLPERVQGPLLNRGPGVSGAVAAAVGAGSAAVTEVKGILGFSVPPPAAASSSQ
eukprot:m51a1_g8618 hypothetical protein (996) ;mRNA; f:61640-69025